MEVDLNVKTIDSVVYPLKAVPMQDEVSMLKEKVKDATGIDEERQRLIYRGRVLEDAQKLSEYELGDGAYIHLVARPENYQELQRNAEATLSQNGNDAAGTSSGVAAAMTNLLNTGTSFGMGNNRRIPVLDPQEESIEAVWQGLVSMETLLSVGGGRESSSVLSVREGVLAQMRASRARLSNQRDRDALNTTGAGYILGMEQVWTEDDGSVSPPAAEESEKEEEGNKEVKEGGDSPATPEHATMSTEPPSAPVTPVGMHAYGQDVQFYVGQWLDVKDTVAQWLEATVMEVDSESRRMFIHYNGWPVRWDEWIDFDSNRIAPFRSITRHNPQHGFNSPAPLTHVQNAPRVGPNDYRLVLPELARMLRQIQPIIEEASGIVTEGVEDGHIAVPDEWGSWSGTGTSADIGTAGWSSTRERANSDTTSGHNIRTSSGETTTTLDGRMRWGSLAGPALRARVRGVAPSSGASSSRAGDNQSLGVGAGAGVGAEEKEAAPVTEQDAGLSDDQCKRLAELGDQLSPLFDRFGRALTDMSPHLRRGSDTMMYEPSANGITGHHVNVNGGGAPPAPMTNDTFAQRSFRSPITNARNTVGTALSNLGAHGNIMDVHLIVSPNPLSATRAMGMQTMSTGGTGSAGTGTPLVGRSGGPNPGSEAFFSQAVNSLTQLLQTQSQILDEQIQEHATASNVVQSLRALRSAEEGPNEEDGDESSEDNEDGDEVEHEQGTGTDVTAGEGAATEADMMVAAYNELVQPLLHRERSHSSSSTPLDQDQDRNNGDTRPTSPSTLASTRTDSGAAPTSPSRTSGSSPSGVGRGSGPSSAQQASFWSRLFGSRP